MAFRDFFRGDRDDDDRSFRDRLRSMGDEWRERERWSDRDRDRDWDRDRSADRERGGGYGYERHPRNYGSERNWEWQPGSEFGEDRSRSYGGDRDRDERGRRDEGRRWSTSGDSPWGGGSYASNEQRGEQRSGGGYGGRERERERDDDVYRRYYGGGASGYGGSFSRQSGGSFGEGGYGRDMDQGRRGAMGYGGYGGMGGAESGSSAGAWGQGGEQQQQQHRGKGPRGYRRSDERIREEICDCLTDDPHIDASNIEVTVKEGEVTMSGTVNSRDEKRRAEDLIERLSGVKDVTNNVRVAAQTGSASGANENMASPSARH